MRAGAAGALAAFAVAAACVAPPQGGPAPRRAPAAAAPSTPPAAESAGAVGQLDPGPRPDPTAIQAIVREGTQRSHVADDLRYLTDVIGPRLTGTAGMRRANEWALRKLVEYGMDSTWLEEYPFGQAWERGPIALTLTAPHRRELVGASWGWAPGTNGDVVGDVVFVEALTVDDFRRRYAGKLEGRWVMLRAPVPVWNPDGPPMSAADSARVDSLRLEAQPRTVDQRNYRARAVLLLAGEGVAGLIGDAGKEDALMSMSGSPLAPYPFPYVVVPNATYAMLHRLVTGGERVTLRANIANTLTRDPVAAHNTVGELRGSERPDEVVLLGAHLDSWDLGTGATDNAAGSIAVLEAARILRASGVRARRTIRVALFSGEEQGLLGSQAYVERHAAVLARHHAVLVLDNGTGRITGIALQGRDEMGDTWRAMLDPLEALGPFRVRPGRKGGTDHLPFLERGVPAFNFDQLPRGYDRTHHSQIDTFDRVVVADVAQAATVLAAVAYQLANLPELLPRRP